VTGTSALRGLPAHPLATVDDVMLDPMRASVIHHDLPAGGFPRG
jgi:hypothetical protein